MTKISAYGVYLFLQCNLLPTGVKEIACGFSVTNQEKKYICKT
jgi:hypothetical protein